MSIEDSWPARAVIDLSAIEHNAARLAELAAPADLMAVVKANAYGHGLIPVSRAALAGGATWLGVAQAAEALELRAAGITAPVLAWLFGQHAPYGQLIAAGVDVGVSTVSAVEQIQQAVWHTAGEGIATPEPIKARIHLKIDTGLSRHGLLPEDFTQALRLIQEGVVAGKLELVGVWSHLTHSDEPGHPEAKLQRERLNAAVAEVEAAGLPRPLVHLANSAAILIDPDESGDIVRAGLALYGLSPVPEVGGPEHFGLRPAMRLESEVANVKHLPAGQGVSYNHTYVTTEPTTVIDVPIGYADGLPRHASGVPLPQGDGLGAPVTINTATGTITGRIAGRICMDQIVVEVGDGTDAALGDTVVIFGDANRGEPTAQDWADAAGTISYTIVTGVGPQIPRVYVESANE